MEPTEINYDTERNLNYQISAANTTIDFLSELLRSNGRNKSIENVIDICFEMVSMCTAELFSIRKRLYALHLIAADRREEKKHETETFI